MTNPYETVQTTSRAITLGVAVVIANYVEDWLTAKKSWPVVGVLVAIAIVVVLSQLLAFFFDWTLNHSRSLRAILFRGYYVEGTWVDLGIEGGKVTAVGLTCLEIRDFELCWYGENHNLQGQVVSSFRTYTSIIEWPKARFWFKNDPSDKPLVALEGICELLFEQHASGTPIHYSGWGGIVAEPGIAKVIGWRITDKSTVEALHAPRTRADTLLAIAKDYAEFNPSGEVVAKGSLSVIRGKAHNKPLQRTPDDAAEGQ